MKHIHRLSTIPSTIISLTDAGRALACRLLYLIPEAEHLHRPHPFNSIIRERFQNGNRLILLCAIGIAVRTIAPVLLDKYHDPAVLVIDEHGRFVVPILSGHEGGANELAWRLSKYLGAQCIITGAQLYTRSILIAGLGCNRGCRVEQIRSLIENTLTSHGLQVQNLSALASIDIKQNESSMQLLSELLSLPIHFYPAETLRKYDAKLSKRSDLVFRATGCYGVAEAAALAHAEQLVKKKFSAELIIPKQSNSDATCAVARIYE